MLDYTERAHHWSSEQVMKVRYTGFEIKLHSEPITLIYLQHFAIISSVHFLITTLFTSNAKRRRQLAI